MKTAKYILKVLRASGAIMGSWGPHRFYAIPNGLQFKVYGFKHKGRVQVIYNPGPDLFTIRFLPPRKEKILKEFTGVYVDQLSEIIDRYVENTGSDYKQTVDEWFFVHSRAN